MLVLSLALCALAISACRTTNEQPATTPPAPVETPISPELQKALDEMGFEKAPTLGAAFRQYVTAYATKNYGGVYDMLATESQGRAADRLKQEIARLQGREESKEDLATLQGFNGDGRKYFAWMLEKYSGGNPADDIINHKVAVTGEKITGDVGLVLITGTSSIIQPPVNFVKENGVWKLEVFGPYRTPAPGNP